jgi:hypothetical protein
MTAYKPTNAHQDLTKLAAKTALSMTVEPAAISTLIRNRLIKNDPYEAKAIVEQVLIGLTRKHILLVACGSP